MKIRDTTGKAEGATVWQVMNAKEENQAKNLEVLLTRLPRLLFEASIRCSMRVSKKKDHETGRLSCKSAGEVRSFGTLLLYSAGRRFQSGAGANSTNFNMRLGFEHLTP